MPRVGSRLNLRTRRGAELDTSMPYRAASAATARKAADLLGNGQHTGHRRGTRPVPFARTQLHLGDKLAEALRICPIRDMNMASAFTWVAEV